MSFLMIALDELKSIKNLIEKDKLKVSDNKGIYTKESVFQSLVNTIYVIEQTEKDMCADCCHCKYLNSEEGSVCTNSEGEYYGGTCYLWYGDELCRGFKSIAQNKN